MSSIQLTKELLQAEGDGADDSIQGFLRKVKASNCDTLVELPRQKRIPARFAGIREQQLPFPLPPWTAPCTQLTLTDSIKMMSRCTQT